MQRRKQLFNRQINVQFYFWRTYTGSQIDYVEEGENGLNGFEIKISKTKARIPKLWQDEYHGEYQLINRGNYLDLLMEGMR